MPHKRSLESCLFTISRVFVALDLKEPFRVAEEEVFYFWGVYEAFVNHYASEGFLSTHHKIVHIQYAPAGGCLEEPGIDLIAE